jgi:transcriptional regulator GlxA family with amidase domain
MIRTRTITIAAAAAVLASTSAHAADPAPKTVGIFVPKKLFITEATAPYDVYKHTGKRMNVYLIAETMDPVETYEGVKLAPDYTLETAPKIDVLVVPSGLGSMDKDLENKRIVDWIKTRAATAEYVTSHCWGAFALGAAGLLDGREVTTFPGEAFEKLPKLFPKIKRVVKDHRFVRDGNVITSNGGLAAFEASLYVVEQLFGKEEADKVAKGMVFNADSRSGAQRPFLAKR